MSISIISENCNIYEADVGERLSSKDRDIITEIISRVLRAEGIDTHSDNKDLDGFTFDLIAYYVKDNEE